MSKLKTAMKLAGRLESHEFEAVGAVEYSEEPAAVTRGARPDGSAAPRQRRGPKTTHTRVEATDPLTLRRNKILSLLHGGGVSDKITILRTQIMHKLAEVGGNSLLVTSSRPGEGKTFTAVNLAVSLSHEIHRTTLLVDADLREPRVHRYLGLDGAAGLSDYLLGREQIPDLLVNPGIPNLTILPGGTALANSSELLGAPRMAALVKEMKERYPDRLVIFDSTSLLTRADAQAFSPLIDGVLLVVEAEKTSAQEVRRSLELMKDRSVMGIVFNKSREREH